MPASVYHVLTATTPDNPAFEIRPQAHWNNSHAVSISAVGSEIVNAFSNAGNVSFGLDGGGFVTASANVTAAPSPVNVTGANGSSVNAQTIAFSNSNGITLGVSTAANGATVTGSYTVPTVPTAYVSSVNGSSGAISLNVGSSLSASTNGSSITFGLRTDITTALQSAGAYLTTAALSNHSHGFSAAGGSSVFQTLSFSNGGGVSFTNTNGQVGASVATSYRASNDAVGLNTAQTNVTWTVNSSGLSLNAAGYAGTGTSATNASITLNSNGIAISVGAGGGVTPVASASNGSFSFTTLGFSNANNVTFGTSAGSIITASVAAPGAAAEQNAINLLGANTAGNTTATGSTIGLSGINLTLSGTNNSVVNISAPATSSLVAAADVSISTNGSTITLSRTQGRASFWDPFPFRQTSASAIGNGSMFVQPMWGFRGVESITRFDVFASVSISSSSNSSHAGAMSLYIGLYTRNASTLSLASSGSQSYQWTNTSNNSLASLTGIRRFSVPVTLNVSNGSGDAWIALLSVTNTTNANWFTATPMRITVASAQVAGLIGEVTNQTKQFNLGYGLWSTTSTNLPVSVPFSDIRGIGSGAANVALPFAVVGLNATA